jgi:hypothetical protein
MHRDNGLWGRRAFPAMGCLSLEADSARPSCRNAVLQYQLHPALWVGERRLAARSSPPANQHSHRGVDMAMQFTQAPGKVTHSRWTAVRSNSPSCHQASRRVQDWLRWTTFRHWSDGGRSVRVTGWRRLAVRAAGCWPGGQRGGRQVWRCNSATRGFLGLRGNTPRCHQIVTETNDPQFRRRGSSRPLRG